MCSNSSIVRLTYVMRVSGSVAGATHDQAFHEAVLKFDWQSVHWARIQPWAVSSLYVFLHAAGCIATPVVLSFRVWLVAVAVDNV